MAWRLPKALQDETVQLPTELFALSRYSIVLDKRSMICKKYHGRKAVGIYCRQYSVLS